MNEDVCTEREIKALCIVLQYTKEYHQKWIGEDDNKNVIEFVDTIKKFKLDGHNDQELIKRVMLAYKCGPYEYAEDIEDLHIKYGSNNFWKKATNE